MIFNKADTSTSDEQVENLTRKFNIHYRSCIVLLIYLLSARADLSFAVHKLTKFSSNPGKVHFEVLIHLLRCIRYNNTLGLKYYADMNDAPVSNLLSQSGINTDNKLISFYDSSWMEEVQEHKLYFINVGQLTTAHMFQDQLINQIQKLSTMHHALQEWL